LLYLAAGGVAEVAVVVEVAGVVERVEVVEIAGCGGGGNGGEICALAESLASLGFDLGFRPKT
jgi:hypothetical protein